VERALTKLFRVDGTGHRAGGISKIMVCGLKAVETMYQMGMATSPRPNNKIENEIKLMDFFDCCMLFAFRFT
jgi:hypothetical protein